MTDPNTDLADIRQKWLAFCSHDVGMEEWMAPCICPREDHRPVIAALVGEVEKARAKYADLLADAEGWVKSRASLAAKLAEAESEVETLRAEVARLRWLQVYRAGGRCRTCSGREDAHRTDCRHYVGPLTHEWIRTGYNGTFGGIDHWCLCGGWFRQGGLAGHGDGSGKAVPLCPDDDQTWRGPPAAVDQMAPSAPHLPPQSGGQGEVAVTDAVEAPGGAEPRPGETFEQWRDRMIERDGLDA